MDDRRDQVVALAVVVDARRVLLARRAVAEGSLAWVFPGGKAEPGETAEDAAVREAREEVGVVVEAARVLGERIHPDTDRRVVYVACRLVSGTAAPISAREVSEAVWAGSGMLGELIPTGLFGPAQEYLAGALDE
ncbi:MULTISPECIES: NUDIX hydrolase [unclassified Streptomyces]|uniref:NUDIX hydrolase n=1 Tax=unclassified Streptomyces TaxID=2593676 RepID=UPI003863C540|nr:NUDIX domain-containing protein [Streptomyces sp. NBC_00827]